jgi:hypothetical protein
VGIVRGFLLDVLVKAAVTRAVTAVPFLGWPVVGPLFAWGLEYVLKRFVYEPLRDELVLADIASVNFVNAGEFQKAYLKVKLIDKTLPQAEKAKALNDAHQALDNLALYQRRTMPA